MSVSCQWATCTPHSITSLTQASRVAGMDRPSALAVFRLMTVLNFVGCSISHWPPFRKMRGCTL